MKSTILAVMILSLALMGCASTPPGAATPTGALIGGTIGGITGAIVGNQVGGALAGAAIGTGVGMITGGAIGYAQDQAAAAQYQPRPYEQPAYAAPAPSVQQEAVQPPPGKWVSVPGQWVGGNWVPAHKVWVPVNP